MALLTTSLLYLNCLYIHIHYLYKYIFSCKIRPTRYFIRNNKKGQPNFMSYIVSIIERRVSSFGKFSRWDDATEAKLLSQELYHPETFILDIDTFTEALRFLAFHRCRRQSSRLAILFYALEFEWPRFRLRLADILWSGDGFEQVTYFINDLFLA